MNLRTKPITEQKLFKLQDIYLKGINPTYFKLYSKELKKPLLNRNSLVILQHEATMKKDVLTQMYIILKDYTESLLKKYLKKKGLVLHSYKFEVMINEIVGLWFIQFTKRPGFKIKDSWAGWLRWKIIEVMYLPSTVRSDKEVSLFEIIDSKPSFYEFEPSKAFSNTQLLKGIRQVCSLITHQLSENDYSYPEIISYLLHFLYFLQGDKKKKSLLTTYYPSEKVDPSKIPRVIKKYLRSNNLSY